MTDFNLKKLLHTILLRSPSNLFDEFISECQKWYSLPAHSLTEMRTRDNKKIRGDIFEDFCESYLKNIKKYNNVWRLEDVPNTILELLKLKRRDMGIDIIVEHNGLYFAVQCKYKKHTERKNSVSWKSLSTFYALCLRTGPWDKYIVMTNCDYARHEGEKTEKDLSICLGTFRKITKEEWVLMCDITGNLIVENNIEQKKINLNNPEKEDLRLLRLAYFDKKKDTII
jgi:predicted helicase